jgi:hypothetical protein
MQRKNLFLTALVIGTIGMLLLSSGGSAGSLMSEIKSNAFKETEIFAGSEDTNGTDTNGTDTNSTIEEKLYDQMDDFYGALEDLFVGYSDSDSNATDSNATWDTNSTYTIGDYEFYFGTTDDQYYFGDVNGTMYFIDINGTLHDNSTDALLTGSLSALEKIMGALDAGKIGMAFGLLTSCEARLKAVDRHLGKIEEMKLRKEEREMEMQEKREEREKRAEERREEREKEREAKEQEKENNGKGNEDHGKSNEDHGKGNEDHGKSNEDHGKGNNKNNEGEE